MLQNMCLFAKSIKETHLLIRCQTGIKAWRQNYFLKKSLISRLSSLFLIKFNMVHCFLYGKDDSYQTQSTAVMLIVGQRKYVHSYRHVCFHLYIADTLKKYHRYTEKYNPIFKKHFMRQDFKNNFKSISFFNSMFLTNFSLIKQCDKVFLQIQG